MAGNYIIYGLFDPRNGELRYVGKTERSLRIRLQHHIYRARRAKSNTHRGAWIRALLREGVEPEITLLEEHDSSAELSEAESWNIAYWRSIGCRLTNLTDGGEGAVGYKHTKEARLQMSKRKMGKPSNRKGISQTRESKLRCSMTKTGLTEKQCEEVVALYQSGLDSYAVGEKFGISSTSVLSLLRIFDVEPRCRSSSRKLLKEEQELEVVARYEAGASARTIAKAMGVSDRTILNTLTRRGVQKRNAAQSRWLTVRSEEAR